MAHPASPSPTPSPVGPGDSSTTATAPTTPTAAAAMASALSTEAAERYHGTPPILHNGAIFVTSLSLLGLLLPPRRADKRLIVLFGGAFLGTNQLTYDYTGESISQRWSRRAASAVDGMSGLPEPARRAQEAMREERERRMRIKEAGRDGGPPAATAAAVVAAPAPPPPPPPKPTRPDWVREWDEAEKKALEDGRGLQGLILDTVREVFGFGKPKEEVVANGSSSSSNKSRDSEAAAGKQDPNKES